MKHGWHYHHKQKISYLGQVWYVLVAELRCDEKEAGLEDAHASSDGDSVEILEFNFFNHVFVNLHCDFEDIALFGLDKEEKHSFGPMWGGADEQHTAFRVVEIIL